MADKKKREPEDTRDVFDKALDYAPIAGAFLGGVAARRLGRRAAKRYDKAESDVDDIINWRKGYKNMDEAGPALNRAQNKRWRAEPFPEARYPAFVGLGAAVGATGADAARKLRRRK